jgi:hypothetical protein
MNIDNARFGQFKESMLAQTNTLLSEREDDIMASWASNIEEAQDDESEKTPVLQLSIVCKVNLDKNEVSSRLTFTTTYKTEISEKLPDPNQLTLDLTKAAFKHGDVTIVFGKEEA